jgi:FtsH-binding integral membrane protein
VRNTYLVAAAINLVIAFLLPPHYWPVNILMVLGLAFLAWSDRRPRTSTLQFYLLLAAASIAAALGSIASQRADGTIYTFLGLCLILALLEAVQARAAGGES